MNASPTISAGRWLSPTDVHHRITQRRERLPLPAGALRFSDGGRVPCAHVRSSARSGHSRGLVGIDLFTVADELSLVHRSFDGRSWSEPTSLGGRLASTPAATAWAVDELQVFAIFDDGQLWNRYWDGTSWHDWESLGGELTGTPAASSWSADRIDVFAPGLDGSLWHRWWDGSRWVPWEQL
jgi:hypothetical protein